MEELFPLPDSSGFDRMMKLCRATCLRVELVKKYMNIKGSVITMKKETSVRYTGWMSSSIIALAILMVCVAVAPPARAAEQGKPDTDVLVGNLQELFEVGLKFHGHKCPPCPWNKSGDGSNEDPCCRTFQRTKSFFVYLRPEKGTPLDAFLMDHDVHRLYVRKVEHR